MEQNRQDIAEIITSGSQDVLGGDNPTVVSPPTPFDFKGNVTSHTSFYGDAMNDDNVNNLVGDIVPSVIVLIGFPEYGKSTFVSSLYHLFMKKGKIGKYEFVDSETLAGFERRSHVRNLEIMSEKRLDRTPLYADYLLSMLFRDSDTGNLIKLILSDRSGEVYRKYGVKEEIYSKDKLLPNATHLVFMIDAEKLINDDLNVDMNDDLEFLVCRMNGSSIFNGNKTIDLIYNKMDKIKDNPQKMDSFKSQAKEIEDLFPDDCIIQTIRRLSVKNPINNNDLQDYLIYLLDSCSCKINEDEELETQINWVKNGGY